MKLTLLKRSSVLIALSLSMLLCVFSMTLSAQEAKKKKKARISLEYVKTTGLSRQLKATVKTKVDRSYQKVSKVEVRFYYDEMTDENLLGVSQSDDKGEAIIDLPKDIEKMADSSFQYTFIAAIENNPNFRDREKELTIKESTFDLQLEAGDSLKQVNVFIGTPDSTGSIVPVEEVNVKLYVERMFGDLLISDDFDMTDEEGMLSFDFPMDIPGDEDGNVTIIAKIEDDDNFGTLIAPKTAQWGIPLAIDEKAHKRELWAARANAPIYLLVIVNLMIFGIWGIIIYIVLQINKIRKIGKMQFSQKKG